MSVIPKAIAEQRLRAAGYELDDYGSGWRLYVNDFPLWKCKYTSHERDIIGVQRKWLTYLIDAVTNGDLNDFLSNRNRDYNPEL